MRAEGCAPIGLKYRNKAHFKAGRAAQASVMMRSHTCLL